MFAKQTLSRLCCEAVSKMSTPGPSKKLKLDSTPGPSTATDDFLQGYIHNVTPMKQSSKSPTVMYFNCSIQTDRTSFSDLVAFSPDQRTQLCQSAAKRTPIQLKNAAKKLVFSSPSGVKYLITRGTDLQMATALHFAHKEPPTQSVDEMSIHESLQKLSGSYVKVTAKIVHIEQETQNITTRAGKQLVLRNATLADETNQCRLSLWASHIDAVTLNTSYNFTNLVVKDFDETKFLSTSPTSTFQQTDDLENVNFELIEHKFDGEPSMVAITSHYACRNCNMKLDIEVNMPTLPPTHKCHSCSFRQRMNASAKQTFLKIKFENNPTYTVNSAVTHKFISENPETQNMSDDLEEFLFTKTVTVILNNKDNTAVKELKLA